MNGDLEVQVLWEVRRSDPSEPPGREGTAESSEERICEPRDTNRIERATVTAGARRPLPRGPWHQLAELPDADPHVGWRGRGMVRITHHPLSRLTASSVMARWDE